MSATLALDLEGTSPTSAERLCSRRQMTAASMWAWKHSPRAVEERLALRLPKAIVDPRQSL